MPFAACVLDPTDHPGIVTGPGSPKVMIGGRPAAIVGDVHTCLQPSPAGPPAHPPAPFATGSAKVFIGGRPALRVGDRSPCGAGILGGSPKVIFG